MTVMATRPRPVDTAILSFLVVIPPMFTVQGMASHMGDLDAKIQRRSRSSC